MHAPCRGPSPAQPTGPGPPAAPRPSHARTHTTAHMHSPPPPAPRPSALPSPTLDDAACLPLFPPTPALSPLDDCPRAPLDSRASLFAPETSFADWLDSAQSHRTAIPTPPHQMHSWDNLLPSPAIPHKRTLGDLHSLPSATRPPTPPSPALPRNPPHDTRSDRPAAKKIKHRL